MKQKLLFFLCCNASILSTSIKSLEQKSDTVSTERIFYRFYLINRLQPSIELFSRIVLNESKTNSHLHELICAFDDLDSSLFTNSTIQKSIQYMCQFNDTEPLIHLIETLGHYRYIEDDIYVREVIILLLAVYKNIVVRVVYKNTPIPKDLINLIVTTYSSIKIVSLDNLLETLDAATDELEHLYNTQQATYTTRLRANLTIGALITLGGLLWLTM